MNTYLPVFRPVGRLETEGYLTRELQFSNHYLFSSRRLTALLAGFRTDLSIPTPRPSVLTLAQVLSLLYPSTLARTVPD